MSEQNTQKREFIGRMLDGMSNTYGWRKLSDEEMGTVVDLYIRALDAVRAPFTSYQAIFDRIMDERLEASLKGAETYSRLSPEGMAKAWLQIKPPEPERPEKPDPAKGCERCRGTGVEIVENKGARPCRHQPLTELEKKRERIRLEKARERNPEIFDLVNKMADSQKLDLSSVLSMIGDRSSRN